VSAARTFRKSGADDQDRTGDLVLTKDVLCQLSYIGLRALSSLPALRPTGRLRACRAEPKQPSRSQPCSQRLACQPKLAQRQYASEGWSGRRGSNPRPTAWKAVTLPLSYSRLRGSLPHSLAATAGQARRSIFPLHPAVGLPSRSSLGGAPEFCAPLPERRLVAREGLEPSKAHGRQIYSLLRLTASLPRRLRCLDLACSANSS
jgi:hypothetical protein